jgi:hypothetical protein
MATEYEAKTYYDHSNIIDPHQCCSLAVEQFLADTVLKKDKTRIVYSTDDMCFRKRIENLDKKGFDEKTFSPNVILTSLDLPFASYYQSSNWEPDDRDYSVRADQMVVGQYDTVTYNYLRSKAVKSTYSIKLFFSRDDDAREAYQALGWEQKPDQPIWMYSTVKWYGAYLLIPCFFTIDKIEYNPGYKESDWLEKSRIIVINVEGTMRSYEILNLNAGGSDLPYKFQDLYKHAYHDFGESVLTEKVQLNFMAEKQYVNSSKTSSSVLTDLSDSAKVEDYISDLAKSSLDDVTDYSDNYIKDGLTTDVLSSYFNEKTDVTLNALKINEEATTSDTLVLNVKIKPADVKFFQKMVIVIPGHDDITITDANTNIIKITGLEARSEYHLTILLFSNRGNISTLRITGTTKESVENQAPNPNETTAAKKKYPRLIGYTF